MQTIGTMEERDYIRRRLRRGIFVTHTRWIKLKCHRWPIELISHPRSRTRRISAVCYRRSASLVDLVTMQFVVNCVSSLFHIYSFYQTGVYEI